MASPLPVRTLSLILILLAVLAPGAAGLCHLWPGWGGAQGSGEEGLCLPGLSKRAGLASWGWGTGDGSDQASVTGAQGTLLVPDPGGREVWGRVQGYGYGWGWALPPPGIQGLAAWWST